MKIKGIVDRIENGTAVIETDKGFINITVSDISVSEGDTVELENGKIISSAKTDNKEIKDLLDKLFKNGCD